MAKVFYNAKTKNYEHDNGRTIPAYDIRSLPHHRKAVLRIAGIDSSDDMKRPIPNESQAEIEYCEQLLGDGS